MYTVILGAGKGRRLEPITNFKPKVMLDVGGTPVLEHIIKILKERGLVDIIIVVGYKKESVTDYFGDGSEFGVNIDYVVQDNYEGGTADAIRCVREQIKDDKFLVIYGDNMFDEKIIDRMLAKAKGYDGVMCGKKVDKPELYGILDVNDVVKRIIEKPKKPPSNLANTGLMILSKEIFEAIDETKISPRGELEITDSIQMLIDRGKRFAYVEIKEDEFWIDIGNNEKLKEARKHFT